jgi:3',5'-cyclic AMP phosphodiesterase CpdA
MLNTSMPIRAATHPATGKVPLLSFVVVADTHVNERDDSTSSPFETNRAANERARFVFQDIAAMDPAPAFVVHLGDIVHPVPSLPSFADAVSCFKDIASVLPMPLHLVPGNHDVGDKKVDWMPADQVCDEYLHIYRAAFGRDHFSVDHGPVRCIAINTLLLNSGLADEARQRAFVEAQIADAGGRRVFLFMHYPPYIHHPGERSSYDNIDEPGRSWMLAQMQRQGVEAVFAGHVHNFWFDRVGEADFYMLPSTAFLRHDFSEFFKVAPGDEFGRGDLEKFGYFVVDVFDHGHVAYSVRTHGARAVAGQAPQLRAVHLAHPGTSGFARMGVELRHPWTESMQIPATGGVQEFGRKWARNDYPLLALWEMGTRLAKVPDIDLAEPASRQRMTLMARLGHRYIVTCLNHPPRAISRQDAAAAGVIAIEVNVTLAGLMRQEHALRAWRNDTGTLVYFAKIHTFDDSHFDGKHFSHFVKAGLTLAELGQVRDTVAAAVASGLIDGVTVRIEPDDDLSAAAVSLSDFAQATRGLVLASLKTSGPNLATARADDRAFVARVAQAMILSQASPSVRWVFDTFMDVDRGYFPRNAFIDRRCNPRAAARCVTRLTALLSQAGEAVVEPQPEGLHFTIAGQRWQLLCCPASRAAALLTDQAAPEAVHDLVADACVDPGACDDLLKKAAADSDPLQVLLLQLS